MTANDARSDEQAQMPGEAQVCTCGTWDDPMLAHSPECATRLYRPASTDGGE
jgi:hypothetical protein